MIFIIAMLFACKNKMSDVVEQVTGAERMWSDVSRVQERIAGEANKYSNRRFDK